METNFSVRVRDNIGVAKVILQYMKTAKDRVLTRDDANDNQDLATIIKVM